MHFILISVLFKGAVFYLGTISWWHEISIKKAYLFLCSGLIWTLTTEDAMLIFTTKIVSAHPFFCQISFMVPLNLNGQRGRRTKQTGMQHQT